MTVTSHDLNMLKDKYSNLKKYKTSDIAFAATLMIKGKKLLYVEPADKKGIKTDIYYFVFEDFTDRDDLVFKYTTNSEDLQVVPNSFRSTMRYLKEITRNQNK